jgi:iduronate 2-sulfatase
MKKAEQSYNRRDFVKITAAAGAATLMAGCAAEVAEKEEPKRPNVLFVMVDDLRPELGCYGNDEIKTPNFDRLATESVTFLRTHCQAAACAPSRASLMLGMRPDTTRVWSLGESFREINPNCITMPQHFAKHGYHTVSMGKIFHNHMPDRISFIEPDLKPAEYLTAEMIDRDPESFYYDEDLNEELAEVRQERLAKNPNAYADGWAYGRSWEDTDAPDNAFYDGAQTDLAIEKLKELKDRDEPFYFALGYFRPHLPFVAPKKYWDLYDREQLSLADNPYLPVDSPLMAINSSYELGACYDLAGKIKHPSIEQIPEETARLLKHGYYASVSYVDACLGRLMDSLKEQGLDKNTIVVVMGDHGWKLGEHGSWCKQTNYNIDTQVPLFVRTPEMTNAGEATSQLAELVDLYPTLCDLTGIEIPADMEGSSLKPLLADTEVEIKNAAFSQYVRRPKNSPDGLRYMGTSMVTEQYHYVEWHHWDHDSKTAGELAGVELYDNVNDPDENINVAGAAENAEIVQELAQQLEAGWIAARLR